MKWAQTGTCVCCHGPAWVIPGALRPQGQATAMVRCDGCRQYCPDQTRECKLAKVVA